MGFATLKISRLLSSASKSIESRYRFWSFKRKIHPATWSEHDLILDWANVQADFNVGSSVFEPSIVQRGQELRDEVLTKFKDKYIATSGCRILIHLPSKIFSPGGYSLFSNMIDSIKFLGIPCDALEWGDSFNVKLNAFQPTIFLTSDHESYLNRIDWDAVQCYRATQTLRVGLTASIEAYGNTPLDQRLHWAKVQKINFYYSFRSPEYLKSRQDYQPFFADGYKILSVEFGANPFHYFPVGGIKRDLPYVFLASSNPDKQKRYTEWLTPVVNNYPGFLDGPGWKINRFAPATTHRYLYARAKVGINLHIDDSIDWASELNERTYILAACGVPQIIDNPKLLGMRFSVGAMFKANSPKEYFDLFQHVLDSPEEAQAKAAVALEEVYANHTTIHRAEMFFKQLSEI